MKLKEIPPSLFRSFQLQWKKIPKARGIDNTSEVPVIVSLTSIPSRLNKLHLTIRSLLLQSTPPEKVILWLNEDLKSKIPAELKKLESQYFEIYYSSLNCSHRKLIHSINKFPTAIIVTADDDCMYHKHWLKNLYESHCKYPGDIIANMVRKIKYNDSGKSSPYKSWDEVKQAEDTDPLYIQVGYGGVLYPPDSLDPLASDKDLFLSLAPNADDLWFKAMACLKGTNIRTSLIPGVKPLTIIGSQEFALHKTNIREDRNRIQWDNLEQHFGLQLSENTRRNTDGEERITG